MFDRAIIDTDNFMDLPVSAKALYFLLGMDADDEGFVSPRKIQKIHGGNDDDTKVLIAKNFIIPFKSGIVVITDWNNNNWLDSRRIRPTKYQEEKKLLALNKDKSYMLSTGLADAKREEYSIEENRVEQKRIEENTSDGVPSQDINSFISLFKELNPSYEMLFRNKTERSASSRLLSKYGMEKMTATLEGLPDIISRPYAPRITTPNELEKNLGKLIAFVNQNKNLIKNKKPIII